MRKSRFTDEQVVCILGEVESGAKVSDVCRSYGLSEATLYGWRSKFSGMSVSVIGKFKSMEEENRLLRHRNARLQAENLALRDVLVKKN